MFDLWINNEHTITENKGLKILIDEKDKWISELKDTNEALKISNQAGIQMKEYSNQLSWQIAFN